MAVGENAIGVATEELGDLGEHGPETTDGQCLLPTSRRPALGIGVACSSSDEKPQGSLPAEAAALASLSDVLRSGQIGFRTLALLP